MPRGGPRPGSGPPLGNLNALKHGRSSRQYQRLLHLVASDPETNQLLLAVAARNRRLQANARRQANHLLDTLSSRLRQRALDLASARYEYDQTIPPPSATETPSSKPKNRKTTIPHT